MCLLDFGTAVKQSHFDIERIEMMISIREGQKGFTFVLIAVIFWAISLIAPKVVEINNIALLVLNVLVMASGFLGFYLGKQEFNKNSKNTDARTAYRLGLAIGIIKLIPLILLVL